jgi:hypothetical protein
MNVDTAREQRILDLAIKLHAGNATPKEQQDAASTLSFVAGDRLGREIEMQFMKTVLFLFSRYDCHDQLWWKVSPTGSDQFLFFANCSDVFALAYADCEEISFENLDVLKAAFADVAAITAEHWYAPLLFVARVRKLKPHPAFMKGVPDILKPLFEATQS